MKRNTENKKELTSMYHSLSPIRLCTNLLYILGERHFVLCGYICVASDIKLELLDGNKEGILQ